MKLPHELSFGSFGTDVLATYWPAALFGAVFAGLIVWWVLWSRRRRRTGRRRWVGASLGFAPASLLALLLALAMALNTWVGYFPSFQALGLWAESATGNVQTTTKVKGLVLKKLNASQLCAAAGTSTTKRAGAIFDATVPSRSAQVPASSAWVYLPPGYDQSNHHYPVIYALHGAPGTGADWFAAGRLDLVMNTLIGDHYIDPMIVVSPDVMKPSQTDWEPLDIPGGPQYEDFITKDLVSWTDASLRTQPQASKRIIAGMSAGGLAAVDIGLRSPAVFQGVIALLTYPEPYTPGIVGDTASMHAYTPSRAVNANPVDPTQAIFLGQNGGASRSAIDLGRELKQSGRQARVQIFQSIEHNWVGARTMMPYGLVWTAHKLKLTPVHHPSSVLKHIRHPLRR